MYKKFVIAAVTGAAVLGAGGTALAVTGSDAGSNTGSSSAGTSATADHAQAGKGRGHRLQQALRSVEHGVVVTRSKDGTVTHDVIHGTVTAVSATSVTAKAADGTSMTFAITKDTKVRQRSAGKGTAAAISAVKSGDEVFVAGTGTTTLTAKVVVDLKK